MFVAATLERSRSNCWTYFAPWSIADAGLTTSPEPSATLLLAFVVPVRSTPTVSSPIDVFPANGEMAIAMWIGRDVSSVTGSGSVLLAYVSVVGVAPGMPPQLPEYDPRSKDSPRTSLEPEQAERVS